ncbi:MAG: toprim domain-containing protein [Bacillota bacterium]|nr:toprim domain-containing protein [Bacillota bacterium]
MGQKRRLSEEEKERANSVNILSLAERLGYTLKKQGRAFKIVGQGFGGLFISEDGSKWFSHSSGKGGGPIQFLMEIEGYSWRGAADFLLEDNNLFSPQQTISVTTEKEPLKPLPRLQYTKSNRQKWNTLYSYLTERRGLDKLIVSKMLREGKIYFSQPFLWEKKDKHNYIVFVGKDEKGEIRYAAKKSPYADRGISGELASSDKSYSFRIEGRGKKLFVFESPIDLLSYLTLKKINGEESNDHYLSLGGLSDKALNNYLKSHDDVSHVIFCLDNDLEGEKKVWSQEEGKHISVPWNHGQKASRRMGEVLEKAGYSVSSILPPNNAKDWNDFLLEYRKDKKETRETILVETEEEYLEQ